MLHSFLLTVGFTLALAYGGTWVLTELNSSTTQAVVNRNGRSSGDLWFMKPGIFVHELLHAVVGTLFGLQITQFSLRPSGDSAAHVSFAYNPKSLRHRLGLFFSASAPVWGISAILLVLGKWAWFPNIPWRQLSLEVLARLTQPAWRRVLVWFIAAILLTFGAALSHQDYHNMLNGSLILIVLLLALFALGTWVWPALLAGWLALNWLLLALFGVVCGISLVCRLLVAVL